ncbi:colicin-like pore-forming protein [Proteus vulgaris]|uniref:colicin-like pore-forming protein n=1 Tax=Proteus vulgaris TaxID=585 RepID=UPI0018CDCA41|nr:colicin-like pore-forming protein [Proteus vulgaris]QPN88259.1 hypothetical protein IM703_10450 [Proteus vulgaris]
MIWVNSKVNKDGSVLVKTYHRTHPNAPKFARNDIDGYSDGDPIDIPDGRFISVRVQKGKTIRSVEDALRTYEKYGQNINNKINAKDRAAIIKALESIDAKQLASNLDKFSKGLGYTNHAINAVELLVEFKKAVKTENWRPFFVKATAITAGMAAVVLTAFAFSLIVGGPVEILRYALIIATVGALMDDALVEKVSSAIGI